MLADQSAESLPPEAEVALAWSSPKLRAPLTTAFQLDRRLGRIVMRTSEPMLGQMRLAWWRDALGKPLAERTRGDAVLDAIGAHWAGREEALVQMVDAWVVLVTTERIGPEEAAAFGAGRGAFFTALFTDASPAVEQRCASAGFRWALANAATGVSDDSERATFIAVGLSQQVKDVRMPADVRALAVLDALALRALRRGGRPLMEGRGASLVALRAAIFRK
jgi:15-cis-phytoene synthase